MYHDNKTTKQVRTTKFFGLQINNLIKLVNIHTVYG